MNEAADTIDGTHILAFHETETRLHHTGRTLSDEKASDGTPEDEGPDGGGAGNPPTDPRIVDATARLDAALAALETAVDDHLTHHIDNAAASIEVQRLNADRARLARSLDEAEARAGRLAEANAEVSRRLVGAMEAVRGFIEKQSGKARK